MRRALCPAPLLNLWRRVRPSEGTYSNKFIPANTATDIGIMHIVATGDTRSALIRTPRTPIPSMCRSIMVTI
ncbi:hypothetical protein GCM10019059_38360 [Camelimonas fluminis]|nr:hypothetical protein GCM10019059_38360 [Camelimonas fluminis]